MNAPTSGTIKELLASEEDTVTVGQDLFVLEPGEVSESTLLCISTIVYLTSPIGSASPPKEEPKDEKPQEEKPKEPEPKETEKPTSPPPSESKPPPKKDAPKKEAPKPAAPKPSPPTAGSRNETRVSGFCHSFKPTRSHAGLRSR